MPLVPALRVLAELRTDEIVVTTMGSTREWPKLSSHPLDFHHIPSAMGHSPALALGLALAQPERQVIAITGDGSLLMSLGVLATIVAAGVRNLAVIVLDNGIYEVTGGQTTAGAVARVDFVGFATAAGFESVAFFDDLLDWQAGAAQVLAMPGPQFICLRVEPERENYFLNPPGPTQERIDRFRAALAPKS